MNVTSPISTPSAPHTAPLDYIQIVNLILLVLSIIGYAFRKVRRSKCWGFELELNEDTVANTEAILNQAIEALKRFKQASPASTPRDGVISGLPSA